MYLYMLVINKYFPYNDSMKNETLLNIGDAAKLLGVAESTMRRWEKEGKLIPDERTAGNQRRYKLSSLRPEMGRGIDYDRKTIAYARVSSHDQKADLERQKQLLEMFCASNG
jgi:putative resolvase